MAWLAQGLQVRRIGEFCLVATMRLDVINNGSGGNTALLRAELAKRLLLKLVITQSVPGLRSIKMSVCRSSHDFPYRFSCYIVTRHQKNESPEPLLGGAFLNLVAKMPAIGQTLQGTQNGGDVNLLDVTLVPRLQFDKSLLQIFFGSQPDFTEMWPSDTGPAPDN